MLGRQTEMHRKWWTLFAVSVATFMLLLDITVVNTALPDIRRDLGGTFTDLQWVIDAYTLALDPTFLNVARAVQGIGGAVMFAVSLALIAQEFPAGRERGTAMGVYGATIGAAVAVGPLIGGALTEWIGWRWVFFLNVPIGLAAIAVTYLRVRETRDPSATR